MNPIVFNLFFFLSISFLKLTGLIEKNAKILQTFFQEKIKGDVTELGNASTKVDSVLQKIAATKYYARVNTQSLSLKIFQRSLDKLGSILTDYYNTLMGLVQNKQLERFLNNTNLRRRVEQLASSILIESNILEEKHDYIARELQGGVTSDPGFAPPPKPDTPDVQIEDPEAKQMWLKFIGPKVIKKKRNQKKDLI